MGINKGKHIVQEIEGIRCTVVENGISESRMNFLKNVLVFNKFNVKVAAEKKTEDVAETYIIGVSDITFNPVIAIYERSLHTTDGKHITPEYWNQETKEVQPYYWKSKTN